MILAISCILLVILELGYFGIACRFDIIDKPELRRSHGTTILRGGGIAFLFAVCLYELFFGPAFMWFFLGLLLVGSVSFADDMRSLSYSVRLVVQFVAVALLFYQVDILRPLYWWWMLPALVAGVGIVNAFNFMDGINGITGCYSLAVILPLIYLDYRIGFIDINFLFIVTFSLLLFSFFNFRKVAKCFAGDVGSISIAFILLFALVCLMLRTGDLSYIAFVAVYCVDTALTICHRIILRERIVEAHRKHAYQIMANELGIGQLTIASAYASLQLLISAGLLFLPVNSYAYLAVVVIALCVIYVLFMKKFFHLHASGGRHQ